MGVEIAFTVRRIGKKVQPGEQIAINTEPSEDGKTFEERLVESGSANGLPTELDELDQMFREWAVLGGPANSNFDSD